MNDQFHILNREKRNLILFAWSLALLAVMVLESCFFKFGDVLMLVPCFWMFPGGLITELGGLELGDSWLGLAVGWLSYLAVMLAALFAKRRLVYYIFYAILFSMLILNVIGCHKDVVDFSKS
jgi:pheromone shutdown protein TraB